jgi:hypothetical protein
LPAECSSGRIRRADWTLPQLDLADEQLPKLVLPRLEVTGYEYSPADQPEVLVLITEKMDDVL